jgi:hypothetical protein
MPTPDAVGLCRSCRWMRTVTNRRGSTFFRCGRADTDPNFPRYPALPVLECPGYEPGAPPDADAPAGGARGGGS